MEGEPSNLHRREDDPVTWSDLVELREDVKAWLAQPERRLENVEKWIEARIESDSRHAFVPPAPRPHVPLELHGGAALQLVVGLLVVGGFVGYTIATYVAASRA